jgi:serine/threonine-protein kinase
MTPESIGNYRIISKLGAGGMGEVYRARDTRLGRDVAIKILPGSVVNDSTRLARVEREARMLAALQHPNIATIHGVEGDAIVMELIEGEELRGPRPLDVAIGYARQIIDALEAAHEKGIVHRDLKPSNIRVTPDGVVKLLDFGLAKAVELKGVAGALEKSASATLSLEFTQAGSFCGTPAYMSPEQARCQPVDKRSDIWAFGVVLYELLSGRSPFAPGATAADTIAAVVTQEPDWDALPKDTPGNIRRLLEHCLRKEQKRRLRDIGDARLMLEERESVGVRTRTRPRAAVMWGSVGMLVAALVFGWWANKNWRPRQHPVIRVSVDLGPNAIASDRTGVALSADGMRIAFTAKGPTGAPLIATRTLDQDQPVLLQGTEGATDPFFSPDGQWIGYFTASQMKKVPVVGGAAIALCNLANARGAAWGEDGMIIVNPSPITGLSRVSDAGGRLEALADPSVTGFRSYRWPQILPGGDKVLFSASKIGARLDSDGIGVGVLDLETRAVKMILNGGYFGRYLPTGHLIYVQQGSLFAIRMNLAKLETQGSAVRLMENLAADEATAPGRFDFSSSGTLVYFRGSVQRNPTPVVWIDGSGETSSLLPNPGLYSSPSLSRDGRLAISVGPPRASDLHVWDARRETLTRLTFGTEGNYLPVWSPDGKFIAYVSITPGGNSLFWLRADGGEKPRKLLDTEAPVYTGSFTPDGRYLVYQQNFAATGTDVMRLPIDTSDPDNPKPGIPEAVLKTAAYESTPAVSPDGKWLAYTSNESGHNEVYVQAFPQPSGKWQVSSGDGTFPRWSPARRQLFFQTGDGRMMVVDFDVKDGRFVSSKPHQWTGAKLSELRGWIRDYDVASDGKRLVAFPGRDDSDASHRSAHVNFVFNFFEEVKRQLPPK